MDKSLKYYVKWQKPHRDHIFYIQIILNVQKRHTHGDRMVNGC